MKETIFIYNEGYVTVVGEYDCNPAIVTNLGETWEDFINGKYVMLNRDQTDFYKQHIFATPRETFFMEESIEASEAEKNLIIDKIKEYDSSSAVNTFYVNDTPAWFNKNMRVFLNNAIASEKEVGKSTTTLWINNEPYNIEINMARKMLVDLELYAIACYNNTQRNISEVKNITLKSELRAFDITKGYPDKLVFNI